MVNGKNPSDKIPWSGCLVSVQPRIRLWRSFDQFQHTYLAYLLTVAGEKGNEPGEFKVAVGKGAHEKHRFQTGMEVSGLSISVVDKRMETAEMYRTSAIRIIKKVNDSADELGINHSESVDDHQENVPSGDITPIGTQITETSLENLPIF